MTTPKTSEQWEEGFGGWDDDYEDVWEKFWKPIVTNEDGSLNLDQIKRELFDFKAMMREFTLVVSHVTGGLLSKNTYLAEVINSAADDNLNQEVEDAMREHRESGDCE